MVVWNIFYFHPYLGKISNLTNIFQIGLFNHQPVQFFILVCVFFGRKPRVTFPMMELEVPDPDVTSRRRDVLLRRSYLKNGCFWVLKNHHLLALRETAWYQIHQLFSTKTWTKCRCNWIPKRCLQAKMHGRCPIDAFRVFFSWQAKGMMPQRAEFCFPYKSRCMRVCGVFFKVLSSVFFCNFRGFCSVCRVEPWKNLRPTEDYRRRTEDISKKEDFLRQDTQKSVALGMLEVCWCLRQQLVH